MTPPMSEQRIVLGECVATLATLDADSIAAVVTDPPYDLKPGGTILDPFLGSGTTLIAAALADIAALGIEQDAEYVAIAEARLRYRRDERT